MPDVMSSHVLPVDFPLTELSFNRREERWRGTIVRKATFFESPRRVVLVESLRPRFSRSRLLGTSHEAWRVSCTPFVLLRPRVAEPELPHGLPSPTYFSPREAVLGEDGHSSTIEMNKFMFWRRLFVACGVQRVS